MNELELHEMLMFQLKIDRQKIRKRSAQRLIKRDVGGCAVPLSDWCERPFS